MSDTFISDSVLRNLQVAIEVLTEIGNYLLKIDDHVIPETRADVFRLLCRNGYLKPSWENTLVDMSRFRNLIVRHYAMVNLETVYDILQERRTFIEGVASQLVEHV